MLRQYKLKNYNFRLILFLIAISILGVLLVGSAEPALQDRQLFGVIAGLVLMAIVSLMDYSWLLNFYWIIYVLNLALLALVIAVGSARGGASRWIVIGGENGFQFQPTEIAKIFSDHVLRNVSYEARG